MPETSIIIRVFNEEKYIGNLLRAIQAQDYKDYEILLVDSGSTDNTVKTAKELGCDNILKIESHDFTFGHSLNIGCRQSKGKYVVLVSAHALPVNNQWLSNLLSPFQNEKVAMVYGKQVGVKESKFSEKRDFSRLFGDQPIESSTFSCYANNANAAFRKDLWQERPFDEYLFGLEDIEWARYVAKRGFFIRYEPKAAIHHIHQEKWPQIFNRYRREAIAAARIGLSHPPQARPNFFWLFKHLFLDVLASLPNISKHRLKEIILFRYFQWKGTRQGWHRDRDVDLNREKYTLFYPTFNQAVVVKNKNQAGIQELSLPEIKPGDILIQVSHVGVCHTDLEVYSGSLGYYRSGLAKYPIVPGHEFSGTIVQIGANNKFRERYRVGEKVVGECVLSRGESSAKKEVGVLNHNGAYSQFIVLPGKYLHKVPESMDLKIACLVEPLAVVLRGLQRLNPYLKPKDNIAVVGVGTIGNLCSQVLTKSGYQVTAIDKNKDKLQILEKKLKAVSQTVDNLEKFNVVIEATGSLDVLKQILAKTSDETTILLLGVPYGNINYNFENIVAQEKTILGSLGASSQNFEEAMELLPKLDTEPFTQTVLPLKDFSEAWKLQRDSKHLKILLKP